MEDLWFRATWRQRFELESARVRLVCLCTRAGDLRSFSVKRAVVQA